MQRKAALRRKIAHAILIAFVALLLPALAVAGQQQATAAHTVVRRPIKAVGYEVGGGATRVDLVGTRLMPDASGEARIEAKKGVTNIEVTITGLLRPEQLASEFLTYVLWAASPDGRTMNLGEIQASKAGTGQIKATTQFQTFSLFVTAEPYFAVSRPSELIVIENQPRQSTKGKVIEVKDYPLLERGQYEKLGNPLSLSLDLRHVPLEMYEARNSVEI
ncbi:MAG TPA: hypothetical protein VGW37_09930, partial [Terriglobia bacterium]|nr:hypothetical protein [Terriglobia bacterium]